jgi:hypothetical protein
MMSFGKNYRKPVITGILRDIPWNSPTLHSKSEAASNISIKTDKRPSILEKLAKKAIDSNSGFC